MRRSQQLKQLIEADGRDRRNENGTGTLDLSRSGSLLPALMQSTRQRGSGRAQAFVAPDASPSGAPGETITVSRASQQIAASGTDVEWDTIEPAPASSGFGALTVPTKELVQSFGHAYYDLAVEFEWDGFAGGGTVLVFRDDVLVGSVTATSGNRFARVFPLGFGTDPGRVRVRVSHTSVSAQTLVNARATLQLVDRVGPGVAAAPSMSSFAAAASPDTVDVSAPAGVEVGDLLLAVFHSAEPTLTSPSGWTTQGTLSLGTADEGRCRFDWKVAEASDVGGAWTWTHAGGMNDKSGMVTVYAVRGANTSTPFDGTPDGSYGSLTTSRTVEVTTAQADTRLVLIGVSNTTSGVDHTVGSMGRLVQYSATPDGTVYQQSIHTQTVDAGVQSRTLTASGVATLGAWLVPVRFAA